MGQASPFLRHATNGFSHWCPGCQEVHHIPTRGDGPTWSFNGDVNRPTFGPSVRISYNGADAGKDRGDGRKAPHSCCHYFLEGGVLKFCSDSTHELAGKNVPLPELPAHLSD